MFWQKNLQTATWKINQQRVKAQVIDRSLYKSQVYFNLNHQFTSIPRLCRYYHNYCKFRNFLQVFYFCETLQLRSLAKIKPSRNGEISLPFTDVGKTCSSCQLLTSHNDCLLTLFVKIKLPQAVWNLQNVKLDSPFKTPEADMGI